MSEKEAILTEFVLIFNKHKSSLFYFILKMANDKMLAEDVIQNTFIKLYDNMGKIRNFDSIKPWLYKTARHEMYALLKKANRNFDSVDEEIFFSDEPLIHEQLENTELKEIIFLQLDLMPPDYKEIYVLREYSALSYSEIGVILNIDENLVKSRLFKIRQRLIKQVTKYVTG